MNQRLKELRLRYHKTQQEMADLLNISRAAYGLYETGKRQLSHEVLLTLADYFDISLDYLFCRSETEKFPAGFSVADYRILEKYKALDVRGQETVKVILDFESNREKFN